MKTKIGAAALAGALLTAGVLLLGGSVLDESDFLHSPRTRCEEMSLEELVGPERVAPMPRAREHHGHVVAFVPSPVDHERFVMCRTL